MSAGKIFYYLNAALITGIALGSFLYTKWELLILGVFICGLIVFYIHRAYILSAGVVLVCALGAFLLFFQVSNSQLHHDALLVSAPFEFPGKIVDVSKRDYRNLLTVSYDNFLIRVQTYSSEFVEGDIVQVSCLEIRKDFYLPLYVSKSIVAECSESQIQFLQKDNSRDLLNRTRDLLLDRVNIIFPSPEAELLQGLLLGKQANLPNDLDEDLQRTGTTHIVVLSGFNITIIAFVINKLIRRFKVGIQTASLLSVMAIWMFVLLAGFSPPTVRAAIMVSMVLIAQSRGKAYGGIFALIFSASMLLIINPFLLRWSLSFELSFLATVGVLFKDRFVPTLSLLPDAFSIRENIRTTIGATLLTLPLLITTFGSISFVALFTNAFILSLIPVTMALGTIVLGIAFFSIPLAIASGTVVYAFLRSITYIVELFSRFSFAYAEVPHYFSLIVVVIVALLFFLISRNNRRKVYEAVPMKGLLSVMYISIIFACLSIFLVVNPKEGITFFNVGQGDAAHIRSQDGYDILVDAGPDETVVSRLGRSMSYFDRTIELFVVTHPHADHLTGFFSIIKKYEISEIWITGVEYESPIYKQFLDTIAEQDFSTKIVTDQVTQKKGDSVVDVLWPPEGYINSNLNNTSIVLQIESNGIKTLLMGDAEEDIENELTQRYGGALDSDILKAGHHGSSNASTEDFLKIVRPLISVISVGSNNQFHHPHDQSVERLKEYSDYVFRTDMCGNVGIKIKEELVISPRC